jgi:hypothetical protein
MGMSDISEEGGMCNCIEVRVNPRDYLELVAKLKSLVCPGI